MTEPEKIVLDENQVPATEFSVPFLQGMINRMGVSFYKYGPIAKAFPHDISALRSLEQRLEEYRKTGNTEFLVDAANFAMIEFLRPSVEGAHFTPTDSDQSPGRTTVRGKATDAPNGDRRLW